MTYGMVRVPVHSYDDLSVRERRILERRDAGQTYARIGLVLNLSAARISQIEKQARETLAKGERVEWRLKL